MKSDGSGCQDDQLTSRDALQAENAKQRSPSVAERAKTRLEGEVDTLEHDLAEAIRVAKEAHWDGIPRS